MTSCCKGIKSIPRTVKVGNAAWTQIQPNTIVAKATPSQRTGHTIVTYKDNLYVFGGTDGQYHYNDTWEYNTQTGQWAELLCSGYIPVAREGHAATLVDDVMYVFAGRGVDGKDLEDLAAFKITGAENVARRWFMFQHMGPTPSGRSGHAMATWQSKVYVLGGESYSNAQPGYDPNYINILDSGASRIGS
jgi:N-acetylneuraminic acid mutarotase